MLHPEKWRETADPFSIHIPGFQLRTVLGYPHAGNDVFHVEGLYRDTPCRAFLKVARQPGANIPWEAHLLQTLPLPHLPAVLGWSAGEPAWLLTEELPGVRLSVILGENIGLASLDYLPYYGKTLAEIHGLSEDTEPVKDRKFFHLPPKSLLAECKLGSVGAWLQDHPPVGEHRCFVHGDCHYANLLWQGKTLTAILDWELAGWGSQEFDMAWAVFRRPGQKFLTVWQEVEAFLAGYDQPYSKQAFCRYYVQIACWFFPMGDEDDRQVWRGLMAAAMKNAK